MVEHVEPLHAVVEGVHHATLLVHVGLSHAQLTQRTPPRRNSIQRPRSGSNWEGQGGVSGGGGNWGGWNGYHGPIRRHPDRTSNY